MSDEQARELRRIASALGQVIALSTMPKKTEVALLAIHQRLIKAVPQALTQS